MVPLLFAACSTEQLKVAQQIVDSVQSLRKDKKEQPGPSIEPTAAPTVAPSPTPTPIVTPQIESPSEPVIEPKCGVRNPRDGAKKGFVWKPASDTQKWAVAILPNEFGPEVECTFAGLPARHKGAHHDEIGTAGTRQVYILDGWTGEKLQKKHGQIIVRCGCVHWSISNPSERVD